jgi:hypothetical protein
MLPNKKTLAESAVPYFDFAKTIQRLTQSAVI